MDDGFVGDVSSQGGAVLASDPDAASVSGGWRGDDDDDASTPAGSDDDGEDDRPSHVRRICYRMPVVRGYGRWIIAGPVRDDTNIDPLLLTNVFIVEALSTFSCREVIARAVPLMIKSGLYSSVAAAYPVVRYVSDEPECSSAPVEEPSWVTNDPAGLPIRRVLDRAALAVKRARGSVDGGHVKYISTASVTAHPWCAHAARLRQRRYERRGAVAYRRSVSARTDEDERRMLRAANSSSLLALRRATTYNVRTPAEMDQGLRALKKRPWRGVATPDVIPPRKRLIDMKRRVFERSARAGHAMVTLRADGSTERWTYVAYSGLQGVRLYKAPDGTVKRLACPSHKQRKGGRVNGTSMEGEAVPEDASAEEAARGRPGVAGDGDGGGCGLRLDATGQRYVAPDGRAGPASSESVTVDAGSQPRRSARRAMGDIFTHDSPLNDWSGPPPSDRPVGRLTVDELRVLKSSNLENLDGTDPLVIVAVEFDVVATIRAAISRRAKRCTVAEVINGAGAWSLGSDGGPICRTSITLFSLALSATWLARGRTAMLPVMYILGGEQHVHSALGDRLDVLLQDVVDAVYQVPVGTALNKNAAARAFARAAGDSDDTVGAGTGTASGTTSDTDSTGVASGGASVGPTNDSDDGLVEQSVCDWSGPRLIRIVGDFSMIAHLMGMTGGSDESRCPFWWPCCSGDFLSISAFSENGGRTRTVVDVARQWELVCWQLARWSVLRNPSVTLGGGSVAVRCSVCDADTPLSSPVDIDFQCQSPACVGRTQAFEPTLPTPMKTTFNLLRRRAGGVRGYPVIRNVPILLQVPVLHCTGSIMKKITYLFLAELGDTPKLIAKRGMYAVSGRNNLGDLYMREHIKLVALILACEDIVAIEVDPVIMTMWSLSLLMSAAWRQALTGPLKHRASCVHVMELAAGLLAPLWSAMKPLDREKKGAGVASLYLHAALVHGRDSMGDASPEEAVITDDHVEGTLHDMARHVRTRVNNVGRAQAVTEFQALADDDAATVERNSFAAELAVYTERVTICSCCSKDLDQTEAADMDAAVRRAALTDEIVVVEADEAKRTALCLQLPSPVVYRPARIGRAKKPKVGKEHKIARALGDRLQVLNVCICGSAWSRQKGSFGQRLDDLRGVHPTPHPDKVPAGTGPEAETPCAEASAAVADYAFREGLPGCGADGAQEPAHHAVGAGPILAPEEARAWMTQHTEACALVPGDCDGACTRDEDAVLGRVPNDVFDTPEDGAGGSVDDRGSADRDGSQHQEVADDTGAGRVPFLAAGVVEHPELLPYAPPGLLLKAVLGDGDFACANDEADACRLRLAEEDMLLRMFLVRMHHQTFLRWADKNAVHVDGMKRAISAVMRKLHAIRVALPGDCVSIL